MTNQFVIWNPELTDGRTDGQTEATGSSLGLREAALHWAEHMHSPGVGSKASARKEGLQSLV